MPADTIGENRMVIAAPLSQNREQQYEQMMECTEVDQYIRKQTKATCKHNRLEE